MAVSVRPPRVSSNGALPRLPGGTITPTRLSRPTWFLWCVAALSVTVVVGTWWLSERTTPVTVEAAVARFRAAGATGVFTGSQAVPAEGVYTYETTGFEQVDVFAGLKHQYPAETTITVRQTDCGFMTRWAPLEERWDEMTLCPSEAGLEVPRTASLHEFARQRQVERFRCETGALLLPRRGGPTRWSLVCRSGDRVSTRRGRVLGDERLNVGGVKVLVRHIRLDDTLSGASSGSATDEYWINDRNLVVAMRVHSFTDNDTVIGRVRYGERLSLRLTSLIPQR